MPWDIISYISTTTIRHGHGAASPPSQGHLLSLHGHGRQETARSGTGVIFSLTQYLAMDAALGLGLFCLWMARPASVLRLSFLTVAFQGRVFERKGQDHSFSHGAVVELSCHLFCSVGCWLNWVEHGMTGHASRERSFTG